jgi:hypothetical protein
MPSPNCLILIVHFFPAGTYYSMAVKSFSEGLPPMNSAASQASPQEAAPHISSSDVWVSIR